MSVGVFDQMMTVDEKWRRQLADELEEEEEEEEKNLSQDWIGRKEKVLKLIVDVADPALQIAMSSSFMNDLAWRSPEE